MFIFTGLELPREFENELRVIRANTACFGGCAKEVNIVCVYFMFINFL